MDWNNITIKKWYGIKDILMDESLDDIDKNVGILSLVYDITEEEAYNMPIVEFAEKAKAIEWLRTPPEPQMVSDKYRINGVTYRLVMNPGEITTAQYIDFKNLYPEKDKHMAEILAIFLIPDGKDYNTDYDIAKVEKDIYEHLPITYAIGMTAFFLLLWEVWNQVLTNYSKNLIKKEIKKTKDLTRKKVLMDMLGLVYLTEYRK